MGVGQASGGQAFWRLLALTSSRARSSAEVGNPMMVVMEGHGKGGRQALDHILYGFRGELLAGQAADSKADAEQCIGEGQSGDAVGRLYARGQPSCGRRLGILAFEFYPAKERREDEGCQEGHEGDAQDLPGPIRDGAQATAAGKTCQRQEDCQAADQIGAGTRGAVQDCKTMPHLCPARHQRRPRRALIRLLVDTPTCSSQWSIMLRFRSTEAWAIKLKS